MVGPLIDSMDNDDDRGGDWRCDTCGEILSINWDLCPFCEEEEDEDTDEGGEDG